jgi:hypothetical protein
MDIAFYELAWRKLNPTSPRPAGGIRGGGANICGTARNKKTAEAVVLFLAERAGFEPAVGY